jgi:nucleoside-diphosphate-sugar epimerase
MTTNLVLGGEGLIGRALCSALENRGERVVSYDLKSGFDLRERVPDNVPSDAYCWFLAWEVGGAKYLLNPARQETIFQNNVRLSENVFGWLRTTGIRFTFTSSVMAGYTDAYGVSKKLGDYWASLCPAGLIARLWNVYGVEPVSERSHAVTDFIAQARDGTINLMSRGDEVRQFIAASDCATGLIHQREIKQRRADITSGEWVSILEMARTIGRMTGARVVPGERPGFPWKVEPENTMRDWRPALSLEQGLLQMISAMSP